MRVVSPLLTLGELRFSLMRGLSLLLLTPLFCFLSLVCFEALAFWVTAYDPFFVYITCVLRLLSAFRLYSQQGILVYMADAGYEELKNL